MAEFDFNTYLNMKDSLPKQKKEFDVSFFSLADDGDSAVVRFPYTDASQMKWLPTHSINRGNGFAKIACLRSPLDSIDNCPLCASGASTTNRFFCKLLTYEPQPDGTVKPKACVWDRPMSFAEELKGYIDIYKDQFPNMIFMVKRSGKKVDRTTGGRNTKVTYSLTPLPEAIYPSNVYVADFSKFDAVPLENHFYYTKTADEMRTYLATGSFPEVKKETPVPTATPVPNVAVNQTFTPQTEQFQQPVQQAQPQNFANVGFINQAVQNGNQVFTPQSAQYVSPQQMTAQMTADANVVPTTVTAIGTTRYKY